MAAIFGGSGRSLSGAHTSRFFEPLLRWLSGNRLTPEQLDFGHVLFRKAGHLTEYAILALLLRFASARSLATSRWVGLVPFALAVGYAGLDEWHQSFVPTRTGQWQDVVVDAVGAGLALLFAALFTARRPRHDATTRH